MFCISVSGAALIMLNYAMYFQCLKIMIRLLFVMEFHRFFFLQIKINHEM